MAYFNLLQSFKENDVKTIALENIEIIFHSSRFTEYSESDVREKFKILNNDVLQILINYPCVICFENFENYISIAQLLMIEYDEKKQEIKATLKLLSDKIKLDHPSKNLSNQLQEALNFTKLEVKRTHWAIKKGNIFESLNKLNLFYNLNKLHDIFPNQYIDLLKPPQYIDVINASISTEFGVDCRVTYTPPYIKNVSDFIDKIIEINNLPELKVDSREVFYRGHGKDCYFLEPSLFRQLDTKGKVYLEGGHILLRELLTTEPNSFSNDVSGFDILTRMQHYGMPTRLLDISSNPLAALYFACENFEEKFDGEVVLIAIKPNDINFFDSDKISCLTNLAKLTHQQKNDLIILLDKLEKSTIPKKILDKLELKEKAYEQLLHFIKNEKPYFEPKIEIADLRNVFCVKGRLNQERIIAQAGSFLLFGLDAKVPETGSDTFNVIRIRIKCEHKENILKELDLLKINRRTIYPSIENTAKYIKNRLEN